MARELSISSPGCQVTSKEAILWLLEKVPHSEEEIAEHFGLPYEKVAQITKSLLKEGVIIRFTRNKKKLLKLNTNGLSGNKNSRVCH